MQAKWYAVYTRPRWEKKVAELLTINHIENYCPVNKVERQWSDRKKVIEEPLFTSYVFVRINLKHQELVFKIAGIINFVHWLSKPAVIRDEEITTIKDFLKEYRNVKLERSRVDIHDKVKILRGPFTEMEGKVVSVNKKTIRVMLPSLGYVMAAEVERGSVRVIGKENASVWVLIVLSTII